MADEIEKGDIYFFYRTKLDTDDIKSLDDVQRFHIVMVADGSDSGRLFVVGKKRLPDIIKGEAKSTEREWMMNYMSDKAEKIGRELGPVEYETASHGERVQGEAIPAGEGRYVIFERKQSTRLAYRLHRPDKPGKAQKELGILPEASFVISVRNPDVDVPGFPDEKPDYPKKLQEKFADKRWIDISDSKLMDYKNAQLLLIGAHKDLDETDADISGQPELFKTLALTPKQWPTESLKKGKFTEPEFKTDAKEAQGDRTKGGRHGGKAAMKTASAAGIAKALKGIDFPRNRGDVVKFAKKHDAQDEIIEVLKELPDRKFKTMADLEKAVGEVR